MTLSVVELVQMIWVNKDDDVEFVCANEVEGLELELSKTDEDERSLENISLEGAEDSVDSTNESDPAWIGSK